MLTTCRLLAVFVNSFYSFWWDVTKDWDLTLLSSQAERSDADHLWGLRRRLHFAPWQYYAACVLDAILRMTWILKLVPSLEHKHMQWEIVIYSLLFLEVIRRWIWIFFRVETEWVRSHVGPLPDDILLGEYERTDFDKFDID